ncbi:MAG TPA: glycosyltransferase family 4 protein [Cyclobacteriaceae bacterium]|nr:glycosyltransferase family 4 protein [Cyclobacteriaceae bacterium]
MILLINQFSTPLFVDVVNAFHEKASEEIRYITGSKEIRRLKVRSGVKIIRSISYNRSNLLTRLFTWLGFSIHTGLYVLFCKRPSAVVVVTNPPFAPWVAAVISRLRKYPFHLVIYDLYPDVLQQAGLMSADNIIYRMWQRRNPKLFGRAQRIITLSESMKAATVRYAPEEPDKILVIHNWASVPERYEVANDNLFIAQHNLGGRLIVFYAGNMGLTHDLESVIEAAVILRDNPSIHFVFIGDGGKRKSLEAFRDRHRLTNVLFLPYLVEDQFTQALGAADIGVVTLGRGAEGISVPSKTYVNMAAGLCLLAIAPEESELTRIIRDHEAGIQIEPGHPQKVAECLLYLQRNPDILQKYKANARQAVEEFTPRNAHRYVEIVCGNCEQAQP